MDGWMAAGWQAMTKGRKGLNQPKGPVFLTVKPNSNQYKMILNVASVLPNSYFSILREGVRTSREPDGRELFT
jgi:hypothetical protein